VSYNGTTYDWKSVAYQSDKDDMVLVTPNGSLYYLGRSVHANNVNVNVTPIPAVSTLDIEPSILYALNAGVTQKGIIPKSNKIVLIYIDAFGYQRYEDSQSMGIVNNITALGEPIKAVCVFPSVSQPNAKAMVTGVGPDLEKGDFWSYIPDNETVLDILNGQNKTAIWVDGDSAPVQVSSAVYNTDKNGDGSQDDEAADAAIQQYKAGADLVIVHFDSTDKVMHQSGPNSTSAEAAVKRADALVGKIESNLDNGTTLVVWADHGCHTTKDGGDHGTLQPDDMYIPIFVHTV
jgi:predicted AlkP superfamily pyrophosphatase or phosphodiesterase